MRKRIVLLCWLVAAFSISHVAMAQTTMNSVNTTVIPLRPVCEGTIEGLQGKWPPEHSGVTPGNTFLVYRIFVGKALADISKSQTGLSTLHSGQSQQGQLMITKAIGAATPALYHAMEKGEILRSVKFECGKSEKEPKGYYTIELRDAFIANINHYSVETLLMEDVSFQFAEFSMEVKGQPKFESKGAPGSSWKLNK